MLEPLSGTRPMQLFVNRSDLPERGFVRITSIPLPSGPVFARAILYTAFSTCAYALSRKRNPNVKISTEGAFPFCDVCYSQYCHRIFLLRHRSSIAGNWLRRQARILTHCWGAICERIAFRCAKTIVVPSHGIARELETAYPRLVRGKIRVIANPVDVDRFSRPPDFEPAAVRSSLDIPAGALILAFCALGNFERKGLRFVLEALAALPDENVHLVVIGGSRSEVSEYCGLAHRLNVNRRVHFTGLQTDIRPYLWSSHAFAFPSAYEGFALACLQAAAAGLPLITTSINGVEEFVSDGVNGWVVERAASSVRSAIQKAARNREQLAAMGDRARSDVEVYRQERFRERWWELLEEITANCPVPAASAEQPSST